jgi:hypothetical protein
MLTLSQFTALKLAQGPIRGLPTSARSEAYKWLELLRRISVKAFAVQSRLILFFSLFGPLEMPNV